MRCLCYSEAAETAVQKKDAPEQIAWTRTACKWHSTVDTEGLSGSFIKSKLRETSFATGFMEVSKKQEFKGL